MAIDWSNIDFDTIEKSLENDESPKKFDAGTNTTGLGNLVTKRLQSADKLVNDEKFSNAMHNFYQNGGISPFAEPGDKDLKPAKPLGVRIYQPEADRYKKDYEQAKKALNKIKPYTSEDELNNNNLKALSKDIEWYNARCQEVKDELLKTPEGTTEHDKLKKDLDDYTKALKNYESLYESLKDLSEDIEWYNIKCQEVKDELLKERKGTAKYDELKKELDYYTDALNNSKEWYKQTQDEIAKQNLADEKERNKLTNQLRNLWFAFQNLDKRRLGMEREWDINRVLTSGGLLAEKQRIENKIEDIIYNNAQYKEIEGTRDSLISQLQSFETGEYSKELDRLKKENPHVEEIDLADTAAKNSRINLARNTKYKELERKANLIDLELRNELEKDPEYVELKMQLKNINNQISLVKKDKNELKARLAQANLEPAHYDFDNYNYQNFDLFKQFKK